MTKTTVATPFPWLPILAIAIGLVSHSYALTSLFPYAGYMVQQLGATDDKDKSGQSTLAHLSRIHKHYYICSTGKGEGQDGP